MKITITLSPQEVEALRQAARECFPLAREITLAHLTTTADALLSVRLAQLAEAARQNGGAK